MMVPLGEIIRLVKNLATLSTKLVNVSDHICPGLYSILQRIYSMTHFPWLNQLQVLLAPHMMIQLNMADLNILRPGISIASFPRALSIN